MSENYMTVANWLNWFSTLVTILASHHYKIYVTSTLSCFMMKEANGIDDKFQIYLVYCTGIPYEHQTLITKRAIMLEMCRLCERTTNTYSLVFQKQLQICMSVTNDEIGVIVCQQYKIICSSKNHIFLLSIFGNWSTN